VADSAAVFPADFVIAIGEQHSVREFVEEASHEEFANAVNRVMRDATHGKTVSLEAGSLVEEKYSWVDLVKKWKTTTRRSNIFKILERFDLIDN